MQGPDLMTIVVVNYSLVIYSPMRLRIGLLAQELQHYQHIKDSVLCSCSLSLAKSLHFSGCNGVISEHCICLVFRWGESLPGVPTQWCASC